MNKIHNNLTVENLIKTEWFEQFDEFQQKQIIKGLEKNLDISFYDSPEFDWIQIEQIMFGLE